MIIFSEKCIADACRIRVIGGGSRMCNKHEKMFNNYKTFKGFDGREIINKRFYSKQKPK